MGNKRRNKNKKPINQLQGAACSEILSEVSEDSMTENIDGFNARKEIFHTIQNEIECKKCQGLPSDYIQDVEFKDGSLKFMVRNGHTFKQDLSPISNNMFEMKKIDNFCGKNSLYLGYKTWSIYACCVDGENVDFFLNCSDEILMTNTSKNYGIWNKESSMQYANIKFGIWSPTEHPDYKGFLFY